MNLLDLWFPILMAAVFVFVASTFLHMVLPWHRGDMKQLPDEDRVLDALRPIPPGSYMFPFCSDMKALDTPEMKEKYPRGPVGLLTLLPPGPPKIPKSLIQWSLYILLVNLVVAYLASLHFGPQSKEGIFRFTSTAALLAFALGELPNSIWKGAPWPTTLRFVVDGIVYALVSGLAFFLFW